MRNKPLPALLLAAAIVTPALADDAPASPEAQPLEHVSILGHQQDRDGIPGSAQLIDAETLARFEHADVMRVLRQAGGVYVQDEEGFGLRPNIGIRGSGLDRSSRITVLEDGVLAAPAPYAAPSAYYFPSMRRMHSLEILKGPSSVSLGSRTIGGAINLRSTPLPDEPGGRLEALAGSDGALDGYVNYGGVWERGAWLVEGLHQQNDGFKRIDGGGNSGFSVDDFVGKLRTELGRTGSVAHSVDLKLGYYQQDADETYLGLTDDDFAAAPYRRYAASSLDRFTSRHRLYQATWQLAPASGSWNLAVTAYRNDFARSWYKLDSVAGRSLSAVLEGPQTYATELSYLRGESDSPDDSLAIRDNNRRYMAQGLQARLTAALDTGTIGHRLTVGARLHEDEEDRLQDDDLFAMRDGRLLLTTDRPDGSQTNRVGTADVMALFVEDRVTVGALSVTAGLRFEDIEMQRRDYALDDPSRSNGTTGVRDSDIDVLIPGLGASYRLRDGVVMFGGVHRGFNPPSPGSSADAEESVNYEVGARVSRGTILTEAAVFYNDYDNLVGTCTASTGGGCDIGEQFDGGRATVAGLELLAGIEPRLDNDITIPLSLSYTWTATSEFDTSFESNFDPWGDVVAGDSMPYTPERQWHASASLVAARWSAGLTVLWVDSVRSVAGQGAPDPAATVDDFFVVDAAGSLALTDRLDLFARIDNLFDETYAVARRPAGLRPGKPRSAVIGFRVDL